MSKLHDHWVSMAIADDTVVAHQLLLLRNHHHSSVNPWACRQRRTTRFPVSAALASPTTPLTWTSATSLDGFEGSTRPTAPMPSSESKVHLHFLLFSVSVIFTVIAVRVSRFSLSSLLLSLSLKHNNRHSDLFIFTILPPTLRFSAVSPFFPSNAKGLFVLFRFMFFSLWVVNRKRKLHLIL